MGYLGTSLKGVSWIGTLRLSTRAIALLKTIIIARILLPEQYGLVGIAMLVLAFIEIVTDTGINVFLLQEKERIDKFINTAWVVSIGRGVLIFVLLLILSPFIATFFKTPLSLPLLILISLVPLIRGFINPSIIKLIKNLEFSKEFWLRFSIYAFDTVIAISLALITKQASSLIYGMIFGAMLEVVLSFYLLNPRPKFKFNKDQFEEIFHRGKWITGAGIFQYFFREGDDIIVGRVLGATSLGLYQMAYTIATLPITEVADVLEKVTLPVFIKISQDNKRLLKAYMKTTFVSLGVVLPFGIALFLFAEQILLILLGPDWVGAAGALKVVAIYAVIRATLNPTLTALLAIKKQHAVTVITFVSILGMGISILPLISVYGIVGAGASTIVGSLCSVPFVIYYSKKYLYSRSEVNLNS